MVSELVAIQGAIPCIRERVEVPHYGGQSRHAKSGKNIEFRRVNGEIGGFKPTIRRGSTRFGRVIFD